MRDNEDRLGALQNIDSPAPQMVQTQPTQNSSPLNFASPTEFIELPSKGEFYPEGHPLKNCDKVEIKFMTAKEEDILTSRSLIKKGVAIDRMIESLVVDKRIKSENLLLGDKSALVVAARISGYGPDYTTSVTCPNCAETIKHSFDLEQVKSHRCEDLQSLNITKTDSGTFLIPLRKTKVVVEVRPLFGKDENHHLRHGDRRHHRPARCAGHREMRPLGLGHRRALRHRDGADRAAAQSRTAGLRAPHRFAASAGSWCWAS